MSTTLVKSEYLRVILRRNEIKKRCKVMTTKNFILSKARHFQTCLDLVIRNKSFSSHEWLKRRELDIYIEKAKIQNYRCRSAFKLIEIDDRFKLLKPGFKVLDVGAAPGSWSQVIADRTNSNKKDPDKEVGLAIAVDMQPIHPIEGVTILSQSDFTKEATQSKILELLGESRTFDCILSDMAPPATGVKSLDQDKILELVYPVIVFSVKHLKRGGSCLIKLWDGNLENLKAQMSRFYRYLQIARPKATYTSSAEVYIVARDFLGLKK